MSDSVVARVADRLEIQPEQTEQVLRTLAQLIKKQSARDGQVRVPGLGTFQQASDALHFEPDAALAEAINHRFAGLETVPLNLSPEAEPDTEPEAAADEPVADPVDVAVPTDAPPAEAVAEDAVEEQPAADEPALAVAPLEAAEAVADEDVEDGDEQARMEEAEQGAGDDIAEDAPDLTGDAATDPLEDDASTFEEPTLEEPAFEEARHAIAAAEAIGDDEAATDEEPTAEELADEALVGEEDWAATSEDEATSDEDKPGDDAFVPLAPPSMDPADYDDPDVSEAAAYEQLEEAAAEDDDAMFSEWAPPGSTWSQADLDMLAQQPDEEQEEPEPEDEPAADEAHTLLDQPLPDDEPEKPEAPIFTLPDRADDLPPQPPPPRTVQTDQKKRRSALPWFLIFAAVVLVGAGIFYLFGLPGSTATDTETPTAAVDPPPQTTPEAAPVETDPAGAPTDETAPDETEATPDPPAQADPPPTPPATSERAIDRVQGGYTLVAGSFPERTTAESEVQRWRQRIGDASIPVDVIQGESNGSIRYRVAIGQVPTVDDATALLSRLADTLPQGSWVTRITTDS